ERITEQPEYYPTRTERCILSNWCDAIIAAACPDKSEPVRLVELGAGTASKTTILLDAAVRLRSEVHYVPVDVSSDALHVAYETIASSLPEVNVEPMVANYVVQPPQLESFRGATLGVYIGSSIGNFSPREARTILRNLRGQLQAGDALLLGTDMVKDEPTLVAAYDDREGVTAEFNLNILHRLNRELDGDFDLASFRHRAFWNPMRSRIEMHLQSTREQRVHIAAAHLELQFAKGEHIHTENSHKFTNETIRILLEDAGFEVEGIWTDDRSWYAVTLARVR
ncbi:MAG: methyltransferase, partial [Planctomycetaceae bacterium]|nr:methyltransferase [Planctomycetaceae bacterium]